MAPGPDDIDLQCQALSDLADLESTLGHKTDSKENSDRAVAMAEKGASQRVKARALESQALALLYAQEPLTALDRLHPAKTLLTPNEVEELGSYFLYSGFADLTVNKTARALDDTILAHDTWQKAGDVYGVARANAALGLLWTTLGEPTRARAALNAAIATFRKIGDVEHQAVALNSLAVLSQAKGDHDRSREYFRHARRLFAGIGDLVGEIGAMNSEADVLRSLRRFKGAENIYRSVFKLLDKDESGLYRPGAYLHLADIYASAGRWPEAEEAYQKALSLRQERNEELTSSEVLFHLAAFYKSRERYQDAIQLLHRALDLSGAAERPDQVAQVHFELAGIYRNLAQLDSAQGEIESAIHTIESQRNKLDDSESRAFYFSSVHSYCQLYIDILMDLYRQTGGEYAVRAFQAAEKIKVRSLLDVIDCRRSPSDPAAGNADTGARVVGQAAPCDADALRLHAIQDSIRGDHAILLEYAQGSGGKHGYLWVVDENGISVEDITDLTRLQPPPGNDLDAMTAMIPRGTESPLETSARFNRTKISYPRAAATPPH